ncbi:MAG TPA: tetratricopeptide repeat protein, partial [Longimicrobiaceae bacterium]|nr:tetratricopeptide repeat protein [Longimicrobiaceae bacterium]
MSIPIITVAVIAAVSAIVELPGAPAGPTSTFGFIDSAPIDPLEGIALEDVPEEVQAFMRNGQSWRAARLMRRFLEESPDPEPSAVLLAARAEAGWGGWRNVLSYLEGEDWLNDVAGGEGWYWLARALEEDDQREEAIAAYERFRASSAGTDNEDQRLVAELRQGLLLLEMGEMENGTALLTGIREEAPRISPWVDLLAAEALASRGDTARVRNLVMPDEIGDLGARSRKALFQAYREAGDIPTARMLALRFRASAASESESAHFAAQAGHLALSEGDEEAARPLFLAAIEAAPSSSAAGDAAEILEELGGLSPENLLAIAGVYDRRGRNETAADRYTSWLESGSGTAERRREVRLSLGRALFDTGDYSAAAAALQPL